MLRWAGARNGWRGGVLGVMVALAFAQRPAGAALADRWRVSGHLFAQDDRTYDFKADFVRYDAGRGIVLVAASATIVDRSTGHGTSERRFARIRGGAAGDGFASLSFGDWKLLERRTRNGSVSVALALTVGHERLRLDGRAGRLPRRRRIDGRMHDGLSRIASSGTLTERLRRTRVSGTIWIDHDAEPLDAARPEVAQQLREQPSPTSRGALRALSRA